MHYNAADRSGDRARGIVRDEDNGRARVKQLRPDGAEAVRIEAPEPARGGEELPRAVRKHAERGSVKRPDHRMIWSRMIRSRVFWRGCGHAL